MHRILAGPVRALALFGVVAVGLVLPVVGNRSAATSLQATATASALACANGDTSSWLAQMNTFGEAGTYAAVQSNQGDTVSSVLLEIPQVTFVGEGQSTTLPVGPCQYIYRYKYSEITAPADAARPFAYVEVDWNTEGEPRGPNGSFASAHFDFHFYLKSHAEIEQDLTCVSSNGKTCDGFLTDYDQMRRFQHLPMSSHVPDLYRPDVGSAIPAMGMHILDMTADYTIESVNHNPVLIYGSFDGEIVFAEASVTLFTLQDAIDAPDHRLVFPFRQPTEFSVDIDWPTEFVIEYLPDSGGFRAGFQSFVHYTGS